MHRNQLISSTIEQFYNKASEETRLNKGMGRFEFERVKTLISYYISKPHSTIIDVGGGTGKYSEWLARDGHLVHLVEPVEKHLNLAALRSRQLKNRFNIHKGESRRLDFPNNCADLVILHGPLYHLQSESDRLTSIKEARRVVKRNGIILAFAINHSASTVAGLMTGLIHKKPFLKMCLEELTTGMHNPPDDFPWLLAEAYYHRPEQLKAEILSQGLKPLGSYAVEGMVWLEKDFFESLECTERRDNILQLVKATERISSLLAFSPHFMIAAEKID